MLCLVLPLGHQEPLGVQAPDTPILGRAQAPFCLNQGVKERTGGSVGPSGLALDGRPLLALLQGLCVTCVGSWRAPVPPLQACPLPPQAAF